MRRHGCKCCLLTVSMLFLLLPALANAQSTPPGVCTDTWSSACTATNSCPANSTQCNVQISHNGANAIIVYNGTTVSDICAYPGQTIEWQEAEQNAEFAVNFLATPFTSNQYVFQGSSGTPASGTVANGLGYPCFKFTIRQQVGPTIYPADPKVVVHGVGEVGAKPKKKRRRQTTDDQPQQQQPQQ
jgi:hypothetical protein